MGEINLFDAWIILNLGDRAGCHDLPLIEYGQGITEVFNKIKVMLNDEQRALLPYRLE